MSAMPPRRLTRTPHYCLIVHGKRALQHGVFQTKWDASVKASNLLGTRMYKEEELAIEPLWVSRRPG